MYQAWSWVRQEAHTCGWSKHAGALVMCAPHPGHPYRTLNSGHLSPVGHGFGPGMITTITSMLWWPVVLGELTTDATGWLMLLWTLTKLARVPKIKL